MIARTEPTRKPPRLAAMKAAKAKIGGVGCSLVHDGHVLEGRLHAVEYLAAPIPGEIAEREEDRRREHDKTCFEPGHGDE